LSSAVVVGSGPNGLACAATLAREGVEVTVLEAADTIGGGARTSELTVPGLLHDECSAVHPMAVGSPCYRALELDQHGLEWLQPEVDLAHPLDDGSAGVMLRSIEATAEGLGQDGTAWRRLFGSSSAHYDELLEDMLAPVLHVPRHPLRLTRFGLPAAAPATLLVRRFATQEARALFGGIAGHSYARLSWPMSSAIGCALGAAGHRFGWVVAKGGSQAITDALASVIGIHGGRIETGVRVRSLRDLPAADLTFYDLSPGAVAEIAGERLPPRVARAYRRFRHGPGAFKVDLAVDGGVPWTSEACREAGTVHVIGAFEELVAAEDDINRGRMPERPFVLVGQQYLADPARSSGDVHPVWAYAHVPRGHQGDATEAVLGQIERFAPGLRDRIVASSVRGPGEVEAYNSNYVGGDIIGGANTPWQILIRPRLALDPYSTGVPGMYICSASTPPGAGAHGMNGYNAARSALRKLRGDASARDHP
jgi:phytoene dehydrogenase-like protein